MTTTLYRTNNPFVMQRINSCLPSADSNWSEDSTDSSDANQDITDNSTRLAAYIRKNTGLFLSAGEGFGGDGKHFLRLNVACPKTTLMDGLERLRNGILSFDR